MLSRDDVMAARRRTTGYVRRTPMLQADEPWVRLKLELLQHTGVFKVRGAFNRLLAAEERGELDPAVGVVIASGGNAGLATAYAAAILGVPATVFLPTTAPRVKVNRLTEYGATVKQVGRDYADARDAARQFASGTRALESHAYDHADVAAGAGVIAEEILEDDPSVGTIVVAVGGGGLYAGVAAAVRGRAQVVAVEPETIPTLHMALESGQPVDVEVSGVASDSLGARRIGKLGWQAALRDRPMSLLVSDNAIVEARQQLWRDYRLVVEHGAATAFAAVSSGALALEPGKWATVVLCGANTELASLS